MKKYYQAIFWTITFVGLTLIFGGSYGGYSRSFFFVSFLFPVILGTSILYNSYIIPTYLLKKRLGKFILYSIYTLIISIYLEILVITLSLITFANYQYRDLNPKMTDILFLSLIMYILVFLNTIIFLLQEYFQGKDKYSELSAEHDKLLNRHLTIISERKHKNIPYGSISYIESVGNYIKINLSDGNEVLSKTKLSSIENKLPSGFIRIHRSIIINKECVNSFSRESIHIHEIELPISRKYKDMVLNRLLPER